MAKISFYDFTPYASASDTGGNKGVGNAPRTLPTFSIFNCSPHPCLVAMT